MWGVVITYKRPSPKGGKALHINVNSAEFASEGEGVLGVLVTANSGGRHIGAHPELDRVGHDVVDGEPSVGIRSHKVPERDESRDSAGAHDLRTHRHDVLSQNTESSGFAAVALRDIGLGAGGFVPDVRGGGLGGVGLLIEDNDELERETHGEGSGEGDEVGSRAGVHGAHDLEREVASHGLLANALRVISTFVDGI